MKLSESKVLPFVTSTGQYNYWPTTGNTLGLHDHAEEMLLADTRVGSAQPGRKGSFTEIPEQCMSQKLQGTFNHTIMIKL